MKRKQKKKPFRPLRNMIFLLRPWWKYAKWMLLTHAFVTGVFGPVGTWFSVRLAQAVIEKIQDGSGFGAALQIGLLYTAIAVGCEAVNSTFGTFFLDLRRLRLESEIDRDIFNRALQTDLRNMDETRRFMPCLCATI
ncbi:MAG: hypothetical protein LBC83_01840 [Oscillospiraceae bacterium]|jgi:ABC-type multidrug transport system fused ATPase/permease subunit|nr:hypothetical protein [Oscillospiraceae bacterium]